MKNVAIYPYKMGSKSALFLSQVLNSPQIKHKGSKFVGSSLKKVINWGASDLPPQVLRCKVINPVEAVKTAGNKVRFFKTISEKDPKVSLVPWTTDRNVAVKWQQEGFTVVVRNSLTGHSGHGILIVEKNTGQEIPTAPLYTKYIPKDMEFRVHIVAGKVVDVQRKIRDPDREPTNWKIRSHDNGFIYVREGFQVPNCVTEQATAAFNASGLHFGAFDLIYTKNGRAYVLEANCAPGLQGKTIEVYAEALQELCS